MVRRGHGHGCGHRKFQNTLSHLHNTYFSYLTLLLQQYSLPNPVIDPFIALSIYKCRGEG